MKKTFQDHAVAPQPVVEAIGQTEGGFVKQKALRAISYGAVLAVALAVGSAHFRAASVQSTLAVAANDRFAVRASRPSSD